MARVAAEVCLSKEEMLELNSWRRRSKTRASLFFRAGIVLDCAAGYSGEEIAERHQTTQVTVSKWRNRFAKHRLDGLSDAPRSGQPRRHDDEQVQRCLLYTSPSPRDRQKSRMPSSA